jgi:hypothetical protein
MVIDHIARHAVYERRDSRRVFDLISPSRRQHGDQRLLRQVARQIRISRARDGHRSDPRREMLDEQRLSLDVPRDDASNEV